MLGAAQGSSTWPGVFRCIKLMRMADRAMSAPVTSRAVVGGRGVQEPQREMSMHHQLGTRIVLPPDHYDCRQMMRRHHSQPPIHGSQPAAAAAISTSCSETLLLHHRIQRQWQYVSQHRNRWQFKIMSYNLLSPTLLSSNMDLYSHCAEDCLRWDYRKENLLKEILQAHCDVLCLQELDADDYASFFQPKLSAAGYHGVYQKRRGDKTDGCGTFFKKKKFVLEKESKLCYFVNEGSLLDRDNVAVVLRLRPRTALHVAALPSICVANTHLLWNPRRGDVKLAQTAMLLAELDAVASAAAAGQGTYCPTIVCGDFNMTPHCAIYKLLVCKELVYRGLDCATLSGQDERYSRRAQPLPVPLMPSSSLVTSSCQYLRDGRRECQQSRAAGERRPQEASSLVNPSPGQLKARLSAGDSSVVSNVSADPTLDVCRDTEGKLCHSFDFVSTYRHSIVRYENAPYRNVHRLPPQREKEVTTQHKYTSCTVDYIFYTVDSKAAEINPNGSVYVSKVKEGALKLIQRYGLLGEADLLVAGGLPNASMSSDHLPLVAHFALDPC